MTATDLDHTITGEVLLPGTAAYEAARTPPIPNFGDIHPQLIVRCATPEDVVAAIAFARDRGIAPAVRSGGHCFAGRSTTDGVVIDVGPMNRVEIGDGVAVIGAGARLGDVYDALQPYGVTIAAGCGPTVGIAGLALGGGLGILGRLHGLTCDQVVAARVVLADGRVLECDEHRDAELFWGLRGAGGGQFGVVTELTLRTIPAPAATTIHLRWRWDDALAVAGAWQDWGPDGPDALAASLIVTAGPDGDPPVVHVFGAFVGGQAEATALLDDLVARAGAQPASSELLELPYREVKRHLAEHGPALELPGAHGFSKSEFFRAALPPETLAALFEHLDADRQRGQGRVLDGSPWGGAYNRVPTGATAFAHRAERFLVKHDVAVEAGGTAAQHERARAWLARSWELVHPYGSGGVYPNFPDPQLAGWPAAYHGANLERLTRVKAAYDPDAVFRFDQALQSPPQ